MRRKEITLRNRIVLLSLLSAVLFLVSLQGRAYCEEADVPFVDGDLIGDNWEITDILIHDEFVRMELERGEESTSLEITYVREGGDGVLTQNYLVQCAPTVPTPPELLEAVRDRLLDFEASSSSQPFVREIPPEERIADRGPDGSDGESAGLNTVFVFLGMVLLSAVVLVLVRTSRRKRGLESEEGRDGDSEAIPPTSESEEGRDGDSEAIPPTSESEECRDGESEAIPSTSSEETPPDTPI